MSMTRNRIYMMAALLLVAIGVNAQEAFTGDESVFIAYLNKDDYSTQRLYMKGLTSLPREDGGKNIDKETNDRGI